MIQMHNRAHQSLLGAGGVAALQGPHCDGDFLGVLGAAFGEEEHLRLLEFAQGLRR